MAPSLTVTETQTDNLANALGSVSLKADVRQVLHVHFVSFLNDTPCSTEGTVVPKIPPALRREREVPSDAHPRFVTISSHPRVGIFTCFVSTEFSDPGLRADPAKPNLLKPGVQLKQISPYLGAEVRGVQVSQLNSAGLDELALLVAERKVVAFRDQDFKDLSPERQIEIAR